MQGMCKLLSLNMIGVLKRIVIYVILTLTGYSKRKHLVERVTQKTRKRTYLNDIENIPTVLDDVIDLSTNCRDTVSFVGFDKNGLCLRLIVKRHGSGARKASLDFDIPGHGCFRYEQSLRQSEIRSSDDENICGELKLKLFCQRAMQKWRIFLRGPMKHITIDGRTLHSTVSLYWTCLFDPYDHFVSPPCWTRANNLSWLSWRDIISNSWQEDMLCYEQIGEVSGRIVLEGLEEIQIRLKCVRERCFAFENSVIFDKVSSEHFVVEETGLTISSSLIRLPDGNGVVSGSVSFPIGDTIPVVRHIRHVDDRNEVESALLSSPRFSAIRGSDTEKNHDSFLSYQEIFCASEIYSVINNFKKQCFGENSGRCKFTKGTVNDRSAFGVQQNFEILTEVEQFESTFNLVDSMRGSSCSDDHIKVISLENKMCRTRSLAGGKASILSLLKQLDRYRVPDGICITTNAFREHIRLNSALKDSVDSLPKCLRNAEIVNLESHCSKAVDWFLKTGVSDDLKGTIRLALDNTFGRNEWDDKRFAVRSSGESEDGAHLSSAGQMETFLCVHGFENIIEAIRKCWASSVSYRTVEYRRQNGQYLVEDVAVLVQEMVQPETAGVLFTDDPVNRSELVMFINASYGLGEAVVSGKVNADTVEIQRDTRDSIKIKRYETGDKRFRIIVDNDFAIISEIVPDSERNQQCLMKEEIKLICETGIAIEKTLGSAQDIEWAISNGLLYILQSRPITSIVMETDAEIMHEFDYPVVNENLLLTTANVQEVLPGAVTPLTNDIMSSAFNTAMRRFSEGRLPYRSRVHPVRFIMPFSGVPLLCATSLGLGVVLMMGEKAKPDFEINFIGQAVEEHKLKTIKDFYGRPFPSCSKRLLMMLKRLLITNRKDAKMFDIIKKKGDSLTIGKNAASAEELYQAIDDNSSLRNDMLHVYFCKVISSGMWTHMLMDMLKGDATYSNAEIMADVAKLLSECNDIYSATVPSSLNKLAKAIAESDLKKKFIEMPDQQCDEFLKQLNNNTIRNTYTQFLTKHGHRCIREAEVYIKSWCQDPVPLIKTVKQIINLGKFEERTTSVTIDEAVDSVKAPISRTKRTVLKRFLVRKARDGVCQREFGKWTLIKTANKFKQAYWKLATMMVCEGRLPDERLMFFLTHTEIGKLIERRSVRLVRLAKRRFKLWPEMNKIKYPKLMFGLPKPLQENDVKDLGPVFTLTGMPVCLGIVEGKARVVKYVENVDEIKEGEILVCVFTDVGWSPYFCLISGLVTELGGLISHGAVVARECGIPCVVNVNNATDLIKTGDHILVDGGAGTVSKIQI